MAWIFLSRNYCRSDGKNLRKSHFNFGGKFEFRSLLSYYSCATKKAKSQNFLSFFGHAIKNHPLSFEFSGTPKMKIDAVLYSQKMTIEDWDCVIFQKYNCLTIGSGVQQ